MVFLTFSGKFPAWVAEQGSATKCQKRVWRKQTWHSLNSPSIFVFIWILNVYPFVKCIFILSYTIRSSFQFTSSHWRILWTRQKFGKYVQVCVCVWGNGRAAVNTVSAYGVHVCRRMCVCLYIYKRDRWHGKESWGNKTCPIKYFSHPFPKCYMLWCFIPKFDIYFYRIHYKSIHFCELPRQ